MILLLIGFACAVIGFTLGRSIQFETYLMFLMKAAIVCLIVFLGGLILPAIFLSENQFNLIMQGIVLFVVSTALPYYVGSGLGAISKI